MKRTYRPLTRLMSVGLALALTAGLIPSALAAEERDHTGCTKGELKCEYKAYPPAPGRDDTVIICGEEERDPVETVYHKHTDSCYAPEDLEHASPNCGKTEETVEQEGDPGHTHEDRCYHTHTDDCYEWTCPPAEVKVDGVKISPKSVSLPAGGSQTLSAAVSPTDATNQKVSWSSDNSPTISVDQSGKVTVSANASDNTRATITVTTEDGSFTDTCTVTVAPSANPTLPSKASVTVGGSTTLTVSGMPSGGSVSWSGGSSALSVPSSGTSVTVKGVKLASGRSETVRVTATVRDSGGRTVATLPCDVTVNPGSIKTVSYDVASSGARVFSGNDFNAVCRAVYGYDLKTVAFSGSLSKGDLYYNYKSASDPGSRVSSNTTFTPSELNKVAFQASSGASGTTDISYTAIDSANNRFTGKVSLRFTAPTGEVKYKVARNGSVSFDGSDFNDLCRTLTDRETLKYVQFELPSSSRGTLYYDKDVKVKSTDEYYYDASSRQRSLDDVSFVPAKDWSGTVSISFTGYSTRNTRFTGTVTITVDRTGGQGDVAYDIAVNKALALRPSDFNDYCKDQTGKDLYSLRFTSLPSSSKGVLYYQYGKSDEREVKRDADYFRSKSPYLEDVTFVPAKDYEGTVTIPFSGESTGDKKFEGQLVIRVGKAADGDIVYEVRPDAEASFDPDDFNAFCKDSAKSDLDYVTFDFSSSSRKGKLYYRYGQSGQETVDSGKYYRSKSPYLKDVSFVPGSDTGSTVSIPFTARTTSGKSLSGTVTVKYVSLKEPTVIRYTSNGSAVTLRTSDFTAACAARGGKGLSSVRFTLPSSEAGRLYYGFTSPTKYRGQAEARVEYGPSTGYPLDNVVFLPKAGYTGTVTIQYTGTDESKASYTGTLQIVVTPTASTRFSDMSGHGWAAPSVEFLAAYGITTGTGTGTTFSPTWKLTRCDYVLMLCRTFGLTGGGAGSFTDVPAGSYYADALATAKALGIIEADSKGAFHPTDPVTRQDAMLFLYRAMQKSGRTLPTAPADYLSRFKDGASVADYAKTAVASLAMQGIIQGDQAGNVMPTGTLSRAEMAVMLHRVLTL